MDNQPNKAVKITSPMKGINRTHGREGQPPDTCWNALNMLPYDSYGRGRVAQRFGLSRVWTSTMGSTSTAIQGMIPVPFIIYPGQSTTIPVFSGNMPLTYPQLSTVPNPLLVPFNYNYEYLWTVQVGWNPAGDSEFPSITFSFYNPSSTVFHLTLGGVITNTGGALEAYLTVNGVLAATLNPVAGTAGSNPATYNVGIKFLAGNQVQLVDGFSTSNVSAIVPGSPGLNSPEVIQWTPAVSTGSVFTVL